MTTLCCCETVDSTPRPCDPHVGSEGNRRASRSPIAGPLGNVAPVATGCGAEGTGAVPVVCTLDQDDLASQIVGWGRLLTGVRSRRTLSEGGLRLELEGVDAGALAAMAAAEQECCPFFAFSITVDGRGIGLEVRAPADASDVVTGLFGRPD